MNANVFVDLLGIEFFTGVPDSQLKPLCNYLMDTYGISTRHIIAANEGNAVALAAGYHLSTGKIPLVYLQNSGIGNIINPVVSLLNNRVYGIPCIFVVGWRGEPGLHDEPQHVYQGEITLKLLQDVDIVPYVISANTTTEEVVQALERSHSLLQSGKSIAFVVRKNALNYDQSVNYGNKNLLLREEVISRIIDYSANDIIVSTTGKASRELYEVRERKKQGHENDFLTVGSMGHSSSIALGIAVSRPEKQIWCFDGDGALLMHMGSMAVIGSQEPCNLIHLVINNESHESVGGMPTVASTVDLAGIAAACGYPYTFRVKTYEELNQALKQAKDLHQLCFIEVLCTVSSRDNLGRPTVSAEENKNKFMRNMKLGK